MGLSNFKEIGSSENSSYIRINRARGIIRAILQGKTFMDGEYYIFYMPELDMSGYGDTPEEAKEMVKESLNEYFTELVRLTPKDIKTEMAKHNFKPQKMAAKNFAFMGSYIDDKGFLQQFDLPEDTEVQSETLAF